MATSTPPKKAKIVPKPVRREADPRPRPSPKALRALRRLAREKRTPARWLNGADNPTSAS